MMDNSINSNDFFNDFSLNDDNHMSKSIQNYSRRSSFSILSSDSNVISTFSINIDSNSNYIRRNTVTSKRGIKMKKTKYIFCVKCNNFYLIDFKDYIIKFECNCFEIDNYTIDNFIHDYTITDKEKVEKYSKCKYHDKKYTYYCEECKNDLCDECLEETKIYKSIQKIIKKHETHPKIKLETKINEEVNNIKPALKIIKGNLPNGFSDFRKILNLIKDIIMENKDFFCYNIYKSLINIHNYLSNFKYPVIKKKIKITTIKEIKENINKGDDISSIKIINQKYSDLSDFKNLNMEFLSELNLNENEIEDISPLENCNLRNLKIFNIEKNKLNNKCINVFKNLSLPNLKRLNLYQNNIKSTEIFDVIQKFKSLEIFFIGDNIFDKSELEKDKIYNFLPNIKEFGITGNLTNVNFILKLKIEKLKIFYISRNKLSSLSILKNIKFENLEKFWASFNNIMDLKEIENLQSKETIQLINLKENKISDINNIFEILNPFTNLEELNLEDNPINYINKQLLIEEFKAKGIKLII